jgi:hypothetical protein
MLARTFPAGAPEWVARLAAVEAGDAARAAAAVGRGSPPAGSPPPDPPPSPAGPSDDPSDDPSDGPAPESGSSAALYLKGAARLSDAAHAATQEWAVVQTRSRFT